MKHFQIFAGRMILLNTIVMSRKLHNFRCIGLPALFFFLLIVNLNVDASYDIDDSILYRVSFNEFGIKTDLHNDLDKPEEIKLHQFSSTVVPKPGEEDPKTVLILDHSDMTLKKLDVAESEDEQLDKITMLSKHGEKYVCTIPRSDNFDKERGGAKGGYEGQTALALLEPLFVSQSCAYRLEHYWTYELCHGRFLRQYHEERDGKNIKVIHFKSKLVP